MMMMMMMMMMMNYMDYYAYINWSTDKLVDDYSIIPFTWQTVTVSVISQWTAM